MRLKITAGGVTGVSNYQDPGVTHGLPARPPCIANLVAAPTVTRVCQRLIKYISEKSILGMHFLRERDSKEIILVEK